MNEEDEEVIICGLTNLSDLIWFLGSLYLNSLRDLFKQRLPKSSQILVVAEGRRVTRIYFLQRRRLVVFLLAAFKNIRRIIWSVLSVSSVHRSCCTGR